MPNNPAFNDQDEQIANTVGREAARDMIAHIGRLAPPDYDNDHRDLLLAMSAAGAIIHAAAATENMKIALVAVHTLVETAVAGKWPGFENVTIERRN